MAVTPAIDLSAGQRRTVLALLSRYLPNTTVWAYGSRVKWTSHPASDLDLVAFAKPDQAAGVAELREAFDDSDLPFRVDLFVWDEVPASFRTRIEAQHVVLAKGNSGRAGNKRSQWCRFRIDTLAEKVAMGPFGSSIKVETFVPSGVPIISGKHLHGFRVNDEPGFNFISEEHAERLRGANVMRGDIIFTHAGNIGQASYIPENSKYDRYVISQRQFYMRPKPLKVMPEFIVAYFKSPQGQHDLLANTSQVGVPSIAQPVTYLKSIEIPVPPIQEQRAIAGILGALDDKIELNRRMAETLDEAVRALFRSWFVDFDPVRLKTRKDGADLPSEIVAMFPRRFMESDIGEIPDGWEVRSLGDLVEFAYGSALRLHERKGGNVPVFGSNGQIGWHDERLVDGPGIVVGRKGNPGVVTWSQGDFFPIDTTFYVVPKGNMSMRFLFFALSHQNLPSVAADSAVPGLNRNIAYMSKQVVPTAAVMRAFDSRANAMLSRIARSEDEANVLADLRDTLLPKLISGEIQLADAEEAIGTVV